MLTFATSGYGGAKVIKIDVEGTQFVSRISFFESQLASCNHAPPARLEEGGRGFLTKNIDHDFQQ